jgi:hypothetical protein
VISDRLWRNQLGSHLRVSARRRAKPRSASILKLRYKALWLTRLLEGMLFGVERTDPVAFGGVLAVTIGAVLLASYVPAKRALNVPPVEALRAD